MTDPLRNDIFAGIDGTGPDDIGVYDARFGKSFVHQLYLRWKKSPAGSANAFYLEGPSTLDWDRSTKKSAEILFNSVWASFRSITLPVDKIISARIPLYTNTIMEFANPSKSCLTNKLSASEEIALKTTTYPRVFLAGWSRGGAGVIHLARLLQKVDIEVYCMILYDAVNRTITHPTAILKDVDTIPTNVRFCYHAMRDPSTKSRESFGHCGTLPEGSNTQFERKFFFCTHGGMGGVPWKRFDEGLLLSKSPGQGFNPYVFDPRMEAGMIAVEQAALYVERNYLYGENLLDRNRTYIMEPGETLSPVTAVTLEQDESGSQEVGKWINGKIESVISKKPSPYLDISN